MRVFNQLNAAVLICLAGALACRADRQPPLLDDLVEQSELVATGRVVAVTPPEQPGSPSKARVELAGAPAKGSAAGTAIIVRFEAVGGSKSETPVQLETGTDYIFFLRRAADEYVMVDAFDGAMKVDVGGSGGGATVIEEGGSLVSRVSEACSRDARITEEHRSLALSLVIRNPALAVGEKPALVFELRNQGDSDVLLSGEVVDAAGKLSLHGNTCLFFRTVRGEAGQEWNRLGGRPSQAESEQAEFLLPAGEKRQWEAAFEWGDYGRKPGTYEIMWKIGRATSAPVRFQVGDPN